VHTLSKTSCFAWKDSFHLVGAVAIFHTIRLFVNHLRNSKHLMMMMMMTTTTMMMISSYNNYLMPSCVNHGTYPEPKARELSQELHARAKGLVYHSCLTHLCALHFPRQLLETDVTSVGIDPF